MKECSPIVFRTQQGHVAEQTCSDGSITCDQGKQFQETKAEQAEKYLFPAKLAGKKLGLRTWHDMKNCQFANAPIYII